MNAFKWKKRNNRVKDPVKELRRITYTLQHSQPHLSDAERETLAASIVTARLGWYSGNKKPKAKGQRA